MTTSTSWFVSCTFPLRGATADTGLHRQGFPAMVGLGAAGKVVSVGSNVDWVKEGETVRIDFQANPTFM